MVACITLHYSVFSKAAVIFISEISSSDTRGKGAWSTAIVPVFCQTKAGFSCQRLYSGVSVCLQL